MCALAQPRWAAGALCAAGAAEADATAAARPRRGYRHGVHE